MDSRKIYTLVLASVLAAAGVAYVGVVTASNSETNGLSVLDYTLKCLKDNHATVYTQSSCGWCIKQSEELGNMQNEIIWIECDKQSAAACSEIKSTPTWEINGKRYSGFKTIEQLIRITECEIPTGYWMTEDGGVCTAFPEQLPKNSYFIKEAN